MTSITLLNAALLLAPVFVSAQTTPTWVSKNHAINKGGLANLQWSIEGVESVALFRISEDAPGEIQIIFTDQAEIDLCRNQPGDYHYRVQTCVSLADGHPRCSSPSKPLILTVLDALPAGASVTDSADKTAGSDEPGARDCSPASNDSNPLAFPGRVADVKQSKGEKS
ncbi:MAG: hypothetical protein ACREO9_08860 [Lysobacterales bacterium]